jgi:hypothetical protein
MDFYIRSLKMGAAAGPDIIEDGLVLCLMQGTELLILDLELFGQTWPGLIMEL